MVERAFPKDEELAKERQVWREYLQAHLKRQVESRTTSTPPSSARVNEAYIVPSGASGDWNGEEDNIAVARKISSGLEWFFLETETAGGQPIGGALFYVADEDLHVKWDGSSWVAATSTGAAPGDAIEADQILTREEEGDADDYELLYSEDGNVLSGVAP